MGAGVGQEIVVVTMGAGGGYTSNFTLAVADW